jgi:glutathione S-transferase
MLALYYKPTCPFCRRVLAVVERLGLDVELRNIDDSTDHERDLIARGGKRQVPYLVDDTQGVEMYESDDIVAHLQKFYSPAGAGAAARPRVHIGGSTCLSCEG